MKGTYLHLFESDNEYSNYIAGSDYIEPFVGVTQIDGSYKVNYNIFNGHDYVDLGLPSGTLWATCNVGASAPEDYGDYYAWGETQTKEDYSWNTYKYGSNLTKYNDTDNKIVLDPEDDVCHVVMGGAWMMPTSAQCQELLDNTTTAWTTVNNINGTLFTSNINSNTMFIPAAGYKYGSSLNGDGDGSSVWNSSRSSAVDTAWCLFCFEWAATLYDYDYYRYYGYSVRGVVSLAN